MKKGEKYLCLPNFDVFHFEIGFIYTCTKENTLNNIPIDESHFHFFKLVTESPTQNKYQVNCKGVLIDVYDVLTAYDVKNQALIHLIKKALKVGKRGHKDLETDLRDILASAKRALELEGFEA